MLTREAWPEIGQEITVRLHSGFADRGVVEAVNATTLVMRVAERSARLTIALSAVEAWFYYLEAPAAEMHSSEAHLGWLVKCGLCNFEQRFPYKAGVDDDLQAQDCIETARLLHLGLSDLRVARIFPEASNEPLETAPKDSG